MNRNSEHTLFPTLINSKALCCPMLMMDGITKGVR
jgi:hypothetical protein